MTKIYLGTPYTRNFDAAYVASLLFMDKPDGMVIWAPQGYSPPDIARNIIIEKAMAQECTHVLFVDSDATWHPQALLKLLEADKAIITGCIYRRGYPTVPTFGKYAGISEKGNHTYNFGWGVNEIAAFAEAEGIGDDTDNELVVDTPAYIKEIDGCGAHFLLVRTDVFYVLEPPWFRCLAPGAGEDFYFCRKAQAAGFKIFVDLAVHTGHVVGPNVTVGIREMLRFNQVLRPVDTLCEIGL